jgi:hypothetical protein
LGFGFPFENDLGEEGILLQRLDECVLGETTTGLALDLQLHLLGGIPGALDAFETNVLHEAPLQFGGEAGPGDASLGQDPFR